jgi:aminocarboxymuconate-semialdehyde decarboxylase
MLVDAHTHFLTSGMLAALRARSEPPYVERAQDGIEILRSRETTFAFTPEHYDLDTRLAYMRRIGLDGQVLSFPAGRGLDILPGKDGIDLVKRYNDDLSAFCRSRPGTFAGIGGLPYADVSEAARELRRLRSELGMAGAVVPAGYFRSEAGVAELAPLLDAAEDVGALLMVHPSPRVGDAPAPRFADNAMHRVSTVELFSSLAHVMVTLLCSPQLDGMRNVNLHVIDLGGSALMLYERMHQMEAVRLSAPTVRMDRLDKVVFDTSSLGPNALEHAVRVYGADRIMLGTDYPYFPNADSVEALGRAQIGPADRSRIASGTICALLGRLGAGFVPARALESAAGGQRPVAASS